MQFTMTIRAPLEKQFNQLCASLGFTAQETLEYCFTNELVRVSTSVTGNGVKPSGPTAQMPAGENSTDEDLYMLAAPERLKVYTFNDPGSCLRGEEIGEYHAIERGDKYAWQKFSRHSKDGVEGWENGKNGKLCAECQPVALRLWSDGDKSFT